jgi:Sulfatase
MLRKFAIAFSAANLCLFKAWREILSPQTSAQLYFWKEYPSHAAGAALLLNIFLLTAMFFGCYAALWHRGPLLRKIVRFSFLVILLRALNAVRAQFDFLSTGRLRMLLGHSGFFLIGLALFGLLIFLLIRFGLARVTRAACIFALILSPFGVIGLMQLGWLTTRYRTVWRDQAPAPLLTAATNDRPRVVWLIFDEMSEYQAFARRPASLKLPNFDRLRFESLAATNAFPPAGHTTQSMPALLGGKLIAAARPSAPDELMLQFPDVPALIKWSSAPDIFTAARAAGFNSALVGWFHPYCRIKGSELTSCVWQPANLFGDPDRFSLTKNFWKQEADALTLAPGTKALRAWLSPRSFDDYRVPHLAAYQTLMMAAKRAIADKNIDLAFIHLPVPHPPYIYDREHAVWDINSEREYLDNMALADRALGEMRAAIEQAGLWDQTSLIVSSDHWWRTDFWPPVANFWSAKDTAIQPNQVDHRIPLLIKLAGQRTGSSYDPVLNTVVTHDLILEILQQKVSRPAEVSEWLDRHRTIGESPYQSYEDPE